MVELDQRAKDVKYRSSGAMVQDFELQNSELQKMCLKIWVDVGLPVRNGSLLDVWSSVGLPVCNGGLLVASQWRCTCVCNSTVDVRVRSLQNHGHKMDEFVNFAFPMGSSMGF